jgi:coenzyme PQQ biosynthesis enzyme PqqE
MTSAEMPAGTAATVDPPVGLLAELTHRCPLQCLYCSNPLELDRASAELSTDMWLDAFRQAADLGVLQLHLSGGEPTARKDLEILVSGAAGAGLYTNLITAGVTLSRERIHGLADAGLNHVQISLQDTTGKARARSRDFVARSSASSLRRRRSAMPACRSRSTHQSIASISIDSAI